MSLLSGLKGFGKWVAQEFTKVFNAAPKVEQIADTVLKYVAPAIQIVLGLLDPPAAAVVGPIIAEIQSDIHVASGLIYDFGANPTATSILSGVVDKLNDILTAGHIKDTALVSKVQGIVTTISTLVESLTSALKPQPTA